MWRWCERVPGAGPGGEAASHQFTSRIEAASMAGSSLAAEASSLFVDEVYDEALLKYTQARHLPLRRGELS